MPDDVTSVKNSVAVKASRSVFLITIGGVLIQAIPAKYAVYATAVFGACAWLAAWWRPTDPRLLAIWRVVNFLGANVGYAKNVPLPALPPNPNP